MIPTATSLGGAARSRWRSTDRTARRRARVVFAAAVCLGTLASCGGGGSSSQTSKVGDTPGTAKGGDGTSTTPSSAGGQSSGSDGGTYNRKLPAKVRIVNLYSRAGTGHKIDVWAGSGQSGKLIETLDYGVVSDPLTPLASKYSAPGKVNGQDVYSYMLSFYTAGGTDQKQQVSAQSEGAFPGDELTIVLGPGLATPQSFAPDAGSQQVLFTKSDNSSNGGGVLFDKTDTPSGKALVFVSAVGVPVGNAGTGSTETSPGGSGPTELTFDVGQAGKGCLPEVGPGAPAPGDTHSRTLNTPQSLSQFSYVVSPGAQKLYLYDATDTGCQGKPIAGPFEMQLSSGDHQGLLLYGSPDALKSIALPL